MFGSVGSTRATKPSPPVTMNQSLLVAPCGPARSRRPAERAVVLRAAVDVVDRRGVVDVDVVELRHREVGEVPPQPPAIPALVQPAVAALEQVIGVVGIDPDEVVVDVLRALAERRGTSGRRRPRPASARSARRRVRGSSDRDGCSCSTSAAPARCRGAPSCRRNRARRRARPAGRRVRPWRRPGPGAPARTRSRCGRHRRSAGRSRTRRHVLPPSIDLCRPLSGPP